MHGVVRHTIVLERISEIENDGLLVIEILIDQYHGRPILLTWRRWKTSSPRLGWSNESAATVGKIVRIDMDGALNVKVPGRQSLWKVSPGDLERLSGFEVGDWSAF
ncbi:hypothetical protein GBA52_009084 [Prunus armeniaca]|nr:hypothetical protein GBA52_009084 [Prunus armeniaca]